MSATTSPQVNDASMLTAPATGSSASPLSLELSGRAVLLATDGSPDATAAARVAQHIAHVFNADVHVLSVMDTRGAPIPPPLDAALGLADAAAGDSVHAAQAAAITKALESALTTPITWPVRVTLGAPASAIAREASRIEAALIVVGLRRHGAVGRALGDETTLNLVKHATCPVLAVIPGTSGLPQRILAALDFSASSIRGAQAAAELAAPGARFTLAYVPSFAYAEPNEGEAMIHQLGVAAAFAKVAGEIGRDDLLMDHVVLNHTKPASPAAVLLEHADAMGCDLIAAGSARHTRVEKWLLGSVSTELVRDGRHSILVIPRPAKHAK